MALDILRYFHYICIFFYVINSELLTLTFQSDIMKFLSSYQSITLLLQSKRLAKLRYTPLPTTVYLSDLPCPTPNQNLPFNRFPKCIRKKGCFISLQEIGRRITKSNFGMLKYKIIFLFISI